MSPPIQVLLVEDNRGDARLAIEAFKEGGVFNNFTIARDGVEALAILRRECPHADAGTPDLILLDLNLPKKNGREVLMEIRADERLKTIPVVVMTTSAVAEEIERDYWQHASLYVTKPVEFEQFIRTARSIEKFWLKLVKSPAVRRGS
jgi:chemotaxis family two-component system response regulator Rcp1